LRYDSLMRLPCLVRTVIALAFWAGASHAAASNTVSAAAASTAAPIGSTDTRASLTAEQVIQILDETVNWYRTLGIQQQNATQPSDLLILFANRQTAGEVVGLAFEIARANAELLSSEAGAGQTSADTSSAQAFGQEQSRLDAQRQTLQQEMNATKQQSAAGGRNNKNLAAKLPELQSELAMVNARKNLLDTMQDFVNAKDAKTAGANALKSQIDAIAATVPTSNTSAAPAAPGSAPTSGTASSAANSSAADADKPAHTRQGIWDLATNALKLRSKVDSIEVIDQHTAALAATFKKISARPQQQLQAYSARSEALASQADAATGDARATLRSEFDTLAWLFKQTSDILIPLSKEHVLLQQYRHNLGNWKEAAERQYKEALATLGVRISVLIGILSVVFVLAEVWRRTVLRYAHDPRRRGQLLLVRKIVLWTLVLGIISLSVVTEISTFVTFAGLLTAGVAVALQSVLVSVVGYFFLIGKYGIRVGDRVQIGTVVGEVIELGLVRMHLMELHTSGPLGPTGRVVAFANLIVFQASGGLFKQIPGVSLSWHETTLALPAVNDYAALKEKLLAAVVKVVEQYHDEFVRQTKTIQDSTASISVDDAQPQVQMHLAGGRMEALIRYPVSLVHAVDIDEQVSAAVLKVLADMTPP
jgi:hypothetical protein